MEINPFSSLSSLGEVSNDRASIADNFESFLQLLMTQLQNQDPLDPLDTNQFTQQLVQFTEVEQTLKSNQNLERLINLTAASTITNVVGYIGKQVTASGETAPLSGGSAQWNYDLGASSSDVTFTVTDASGAVVHTENRSAPAGSGTFLWDGRTATGGTAPDGSYTLAVRALDSSGGRIDASTSITGVVDGVDMSGSDVLLSVGSRQIRLDEVTSIRTP